MSEEMNDPPKEDLLQCGGQINLEISDTLHNVGYDIRFRYFENSRKILVFSDGTNYTISKHAVICIKRMSLEKERAH